MKDLIPVVNEKCTQPPNRIFSRESEDSWPFMAQGSLLEELERLVCPLTSQTLRHWRQEHLISSPSRYNVGQRANISSYKLFVCAECYAATILTLGKLPVGEPQIETSMMPKISLSTVAFLRYCAYGRGDHPVLPRRAEIEKAFGWQLPDMPDFSSLNLTVDPKMFPIADGLYADFYKGCQNLWEKLFVDGMIKFALGGKLIDPKRNERVHGSLDRESTNFKDGIHWNT